MKRRYYLMAIYDSRKSFYGKCEVEETNTKAVLYSYLSPVCEINKVNNTYKLNKKIDDELLFSQTTLRHIREFLLQFGVKTDMRKKALKQGARK